MSPITLGILAVSGAQADDYELIATAYGTGSSGVITFSSIPQTYKHLELRGFSRTDGTSTASGGYLAVQGTINSFVTNTQVNAWIETNGSTRQANQSTAAVVQFFGFTNNSYTTNFDAGVHAGLIMQFPNYRDTLNFIPAFRNNFYICGSYGSANRRAVTTGYNRFPSGSAITSLQINSPDGNWTTTTRFSLYGIRG